MKKTEYYWKNKAEPHHTDWVEVGFQLSKQQRDASIEWMRNHNIEKHGGKPNRYSGAIGGSFSWVFTGTSLGEVVEVVCTACEEGVNLTNFNEW